MKKFVANLDTIGEINDFKLRNKFTEYGIHLTILNNDVFCFTNLTKKTITKFDSNKFVTYFRMLLPLRLFMNGIYY